MKWLFPLVLFFAGVLYFRNFIVKRGRDHGIHIREIRRRSRRFLFSAFLVFTGLTLLFTGLRIGWLGGLTALAGILILSGATITGLMKLRGWLS
ncbi:hypothetical protein GCM10007416_09830 [Kroppenstedtia guangzhouensis]|jgi:hypothetical protein|uniref:YtpI-like protein n=1 Tax=Kroppenstedtia guangzhouensis TaxID=1274356 RepID=A0ABQ1G8L4_9BACL|nr:hypothetical protein GCM10007416_09830 [Kroppenstedtia guangzhouensis]